MIPKPYTKLETIEIMIVETTNQMTKSEVMEKLLLRIRLADASKAVDMQLGTTQSQIRNFKDTLKHLEAIKASLLAEEPKIV